jgi:RNA polymerase sigma factor (sigma-70 family)
MERGEIEQKIQSLIDGLDASHTLSSLHYAARLVRHRSGMRDEHQLWIPGLPDEQSEKERKTGMQIVISLEHDLGISADNWDGHTQNIVLSALYRNAHAATRTRYGTFDEDRAKRDYAPCRQLDLGFTSVKEEFGAWTRDATLKRLAEIIDTSLSEDERRLLSAVYVDELDIQDYAKRLGISERSVRIQWHRILRTLRDALGKAVEPAP